jgi:hypothetical protein
MWMFDKLDIHNDPNKSCLLQMHMLRHSSSAVIKSSAQSHSMRSKTVLRCVAVGEQVCFYKLDGFPKARASFSTCNSEACE